jgi:hypothetical protein
MHQAGALRPKTNHLNVPESNDLQGISPGETRALAFSSTMTRHFMRPISTESIRRAVSYISLALVSISSCAFAQDQATGNAPQQQSTAAKAGGWRRVTDPPPDQAQYAQNQSGPAQPGPVYDAHGPSDPGYAQADPNQPGSQQQNFPPPNYQQNPPPPNYQQSPPPYGVPSQLTIRPGTFVTVRLNQALSSDRNQPGNAFSATLARPIVVDGVVVAQRGQTVGGRVTEAQKAGRVEGVSRLGIQLTDITLVDGQQLPIRSQMMNLSGPTSAGRDAGAVATTTAVGAAIGAAADWGTGAAIGAGAGAAAGVIGVLLTRGRPTEIYPESVLTFRVEAPVTFSTERAPQAFRYVDPSDYERPYDNEPAPPRTAMAAPPPPYYAPAYPNYSFYYGPAYYPYYWGPGFSFYAGPRYFGPRYYYRGGFYGHGYRR